MSSAWPRVSFGNFLEPNSRPYELGPEEDANLVGMRWYGDGPFHRELKPALKIGKKSHFVIQSGDVIYNKLFAWKGSFGVVAPELDGMYVSDKFPTYRLDRGRVDEGYLKWFFRYPPLWEEARRMSTGSAAISKLTLNPPKFLLLTIPMPALEEQARIAQRIEDLVGRVAQIHQLREQSIQETKSIVRSVLRQLSVTLSISGTLGDVLVEPPRNGWSAKCDNASGGTPVLGLGAVTGFRYRGSEFKRTSLPAAANGHFWLKPGELLITRSNTPELVGHAAIFDGKPFPCIYPDLMMRLRLNEKIALKQFVWYWLQSPLVREFIMSNAKGTSSTMKKISQGIVMSIPFPSRVSVAQQLEIVEELDAVQESVKSLSKLQNETALSADSLIPSVVEHAFTGQL